MRAIFYRCIYKIKKYFPYVRVGKSTPKIPLSHLLEAFTEKIGCS
jgi:hypothetical protein